MIIFIRGHGIWVRGHGYRIGGHKVEVFMTEFHVCFLVFMIPCNY